MVGLKNRKLDIIYEDRDIIVVNKPTNLLTISTDNEKEKTLFHQVMMYLKKKNKNNKVFIVHRLDRDTSGIVVFAKSEEMKHLLQDDWNNLAINRGYVAVVEGKPPKNKGVKRSWLKETKTLLVYSSTKMGDGKEAITEYRTVYNSNLFTLLDIKIKTGRKNQIRVHMKDLGCPIVGDKKYGAKTNPMRRLMLHHNLLELVNPKTGKVMKFETDIPNNFIKIMDM